MGNISGLDWIWDSKLLSVCEKIPEANMTQIDWFRNSAGFQLNLETGERIWYVPKKLL